MEIINNSLTHFLLTKQKDKELHQYTKRFKSSKQVLESHLGSPIKFTKYISKINMYDPGDNKKILDCIWKLGEDTLHRNTFKTQTMKNMVISSKTYANKKKLEKKNFQKQ